MSPSTGLVRALDRVMNTFDTPAMERPTLREVGRVKSVSEGIARVTGLPKVGSEELIRFENDLMGLAFNLDPDEIGVILLDPGRDLNAGDRARRTGRVLDVPVGENLQGRVIDALGRPVDAGEPIRVSQRRSVEREAPPVLDRAPVTVPLQTGIKAVDAMVPIGRGQRELILGDRQTGKTTVAVDTILNQKDSNVSCVYCALGQRSSAVAGVIEALRKQGAMDYTTVVVASEEDPAGQRFIAPFSAMTMAEFYRDRGEDALVVFDDLTRHARAYRELSLLLRRPPGREAFPGDIFYLHSRLLERSTHLKEAFGGGSLTALPIIETEAQNISGYIPTNLISITDGQIYLSPDLFQKGILPPVEIGQSVSRVGGKTQLPAYRDVVGDLKLSYSQFQELESFAHFGARLEEKTRAQLERGRRVREILRQNEHDHWTPDEQMIVLLCVTEGLFDDVPLDEVEGAERALKANVPGDCPAVVNKIRSGEPLTDEDREAILTASRTQLEGAGFIDAGT